MLVFLYMRTIAISDIHGCLHTFRYMLEFKLKLKPEDQLYLLGDFIDRGPDSKGVIDYILKLQAEGYQLHGLLGNHEEMLLTSFHDPIMRDVWERNGGMATLHSFGTMQAKGIDNQYIEFFRQLPLFIEAGDFLFVHAGLNFKKSDPLQDREGILWSRNWENRINYQWLDNRKIIYGHTPQKRET